jgi:hypothetical protein
MSAAKTIMIIADRVKRQNKLEIFSRLALGVARLNRGTGIAI